MVLSQNNLNLGALSFVQSLGCVQLFITPWTAAHQVSLSPTISEFAQVHGRCLSEAIQPFHPLLPPSPFALNFSQHQGLFQRVSSLHQVAKIQSTKFRASSNSSSSEHPGLISFRTDWFDLLAVQGILKSLLQHHKLIASILHHSAFFMNELSHLYLTTGKTKLDRPSLA